jgi:hypothetical protein
VNRLCAAGPGPDGPFPALLPDAAGGVVIVEDRPFARFRDEVDAAVSEVSRALAGRTGALGLLRRGDGGVPEYRFDLCAALADLRDLTCRLLREANAAGELTGAQRHLLRASGIGFETAPPPPAASPPAASPAGPGDARRSGVLRTIAAALRGGDTLPLVGGRLVKTGREVRRRGSASFLPEVEQACPAALLEYLAAPLPRRALRTANATAAREALGVNAAAQASRALVDLLARVANREWSPAVADGRDLERAGIALDGVRDALTERTGPAQDVTGTRGARITRIADYLLPVLSDLVVRAVADEAATPGADGRKTYQAARDRAGTLLAGWVQRVRDDGVTAITSFAGSGPGLASPGPGDLAAIREAFLYPPGEEMWQLCAPQDLTVLDVTMPPYVVRFASRLSKDALAGTLARWEIEWTPPATPAGLLRLVPLQAGIAAAGWASTPAPPAVERPYGVPADRRREGPVVIRLRSA